MNCIKSVDLSLAKILFVLFTVAGGVTAQDVEKLAVEQADSAAKLDSISKPTHVAETNADALAKSEWTLFRGNAFATGESKSCLPDRLELLWKYEVKDGAFEATPVIVDGVCYLPDLDGTLHALDLQNGKPKWTKKTGAFAFAASPAYRDGLLYVGDIDGIFYCFDLDGNAKWKFTPEDGGAEISSSANFYEGNVLYGSQDARLYCLDAETGKLAWPPVEVPDQIRSSPTVVEDRSFVAGCDGHLHIIDLKLGKEVASIPINAPTGTTPAVQGDFVYFGTEGGDFFKINWRNAKIEWQFSERKHREIRSSAAVNQDMVVFGSKSKIAYAVNPKTGKEVWRFTCKRAVDSSPVIACDRVFVAASDGRLYLLDLLTGKEIWKKETGDSFTGSPAVVDGKLIIASDDGVVYCFGEKTP